MARVKDKHEFDMPTPCPMGGTIDLSGSFSSSLASNKGGNAAVAAITASANNSAKKMLFPKKNKGAGSVASLSKKKFTSTKKRRSSLLSVSTDGLSGQTMATSSLSKSSSSTNRDKKEKDKNHPDFMLQHLVEQGKAKELRKVQVQAADEVRTQKMFEIKVKAKEAQAVALERQAAALERKAEAEELEKHNRIERKDANFFFELLEGGMAKGQIKNFYPRLAKFCRPEE